MLGRAGHLGRKHPEQVPAHDRRRVDGACHWVSNEGPKILPEVHNTGPKMPDDAARLVLGVDGRAVAWTDGHGRAMTWLP